MAYTKCETSRNSNNRNISPTQQPYRLRLNLAAMIETKGASSDSDLGGTRCSSRKTVAVAKLKR